MIEGILVEGMLYGIMALGVFITFRILDFPDLTVDGTFPLGAAVMAAAITTGMPSWAGILLAVCGGLLAGAFTAFIHNRIKIPSLLAGIITMTMLYSVNIRVLGQRANLPIGRRETLLSRFVDLTGTVMASEWGKALFFLLVVIVILYLLDLFFRTDLGLTLGAMGDNEQMVVSSGVNPETMKYIGVGLANGLVALAGACAVMTQKFADVNLGQGIIIQGLAMVMIGEFLIRSNKITLVTLRVVLGAIVYKAIMFIGRSYGFYIKMTPDDLKFVTGLMLIVILFVSRGKKAKQGGRQ